MIKAIVFDCFGVLAEDGWLPFKRKYIAENKILADQISDLGKQNDYGMITEAEYFHQASELIGVDEQELRSAIGRRVANKDLLNFISVELKDRYKIGLLSNANFDVVHELFNEEQAKLFDASTISYESKLIKPDPRMFELMAQRLGVDVEECLFIDDVPRYCIAAQDVGMKSIIYLNPEQAKAEINQSL